jgi:hypothetical protein
MRPVGRFVRAVPGVGKLLVAAGLLLLTADAAPAANINIDFGTVFGSPSTAYGAAAGQTGTWNAFTNSPASAALLDVTGAASGVTLAVTPGRTQFSFNNAGTSGNDQALMDDFLDLRNIPSSLTTFTFSGLTPGTYNVYTYAWASDSASARTTVAVAGALQGSQAVGGAWPGGQALGVTYALHTVTLTGGNLVVTAGPTTGFGALNGFQIQTVPEPSTLVLSSLGIGALALAQLRRRWSAMAPGDGRRYAGSGPRT